jgi:hypothetical protein
MVSQLTQIALQALLTAALAWGGCSQTGCALLAAPWNVPVANSSSNQNTAAATSGNGNTSSRPG